MSLHDALAAASSFDPKGLAPLLLDGHVLGWVGPSIATQLRRWPEVFARRADAIVIAPAAPQALTHALGAIARTLAGEGLIRGWRNERFTISAPASGEPLFALERAAMRAFGLTARAAHLNGFVPDASGWRMWIARRSYTKPIDPGMLDNLVGGGIPEGMDAPRTLVKECAEEAGIPPALAAAAAAVGRFRVRRLASEGVHDEILDCFDLDLPADFRPLNQDGEVAEFMLVTPGELVARLAVGEFTVDAGVVAMDFLARRGCLRSDPGLERRIEALRVRP
jgi:8-oxo-dGTP pyrophosphatase MutT (NUDIX family)